MVKDVKLLASETKRVVIHNERYKRTWDKTPTSRRRILKNQIKYLITGLSFSGLGISIFC